MSTFDEVLSAVQGLTAEDRLRLIDAIWDALPPEQWPAPSADWIAEAQRRSAEYDAGQMSASKWQDVRKRARQKADLDD